MEVEAHLAELFLGVGGVGGGGRGRERVSVYAPPWLWFFLAGATPTTRRQGTGRRSRDSGAFIFPQTRRKTARTAGGFLG